MLTMSHIINLKVYISLLLFLIHSAKSEFCTDIGGPECDCSSFDEIICGPHLDTDKLKGVFKNITNGKSKVNHFKKIIVSSNAVSIIEKATFSDVTFDEIEISCPNLKLIEIDAFTGTNLVTKRLYLHSMPKLTSTDNTIFQEFSTFRNLEYLSIKGTNISEIPINAFQPLEGKQDKLKIIIFSGQSFKIIRSKAFASLNNLSELTFDNVTFDHIPDFAFALDEHSNDTITISLINTPLNEIELNPFSLLNIQRPTNLTLDLEYAVLPEKIFLPFLNENEKNTFTFKYNKLDCDDCRNYWMIKKLKSTKNRFPGINCSNGAVLDIEGNFKGCEYIYSQAIKPCHHMNGTIICDGHKNLNLEEIFNNLSTNMTAVNDDSKHFAKFYMNNSEITEIKDYTFKDITFDEIMIERCVNLENIKLNGFNGTNLVTKVLKIQNNHHLTSVSNTIWQTLNSFKNLEKLYLNYNQIKIIPSPAFNNDQNNLTEIQLFGDSYEKLGEKSFFSLANLHQLSFDSAKFDHIPSYAFYFYHSSDQFFHLSFSHCPNLNSNSFEKNSFNAIYRPTIINFNPVQDLTYLPEAFQGFLEANNKNLIDFHYDIIDCNDCRNKWITSGQTFQQRLLNIKCSNEKEINDTANFICSNA